MDENVSLEEALQMSKEINQEEINKSESSSSQDDDDDQLQQAIKMSEELENRGDKAHDVDEQEAIQEGLRLSLEEMTKSLRPDELMRESNAPVALINQNNSNPIRYN